MKKIKKIILITSCFLSLTACQNVPVWKYSMFERPEGNRNYPPVYISGWQDGCESGAEASANHLYRFKYKFRQDWKMLNCQPAYKIDPLCASKIDPPTAKYPAIRDMSDRACRKIKKAVDDKIYTTKKCINFEYMRRIHNSAITRATSSVQNVNLA